MFYLEQRVFCGSIGRNSYNCVNTVLVRRIVAVPLFTARFPLWPAISIGFAWNSCLELSVSIGIWSFAVFFQFQFQFNLLPTNKIISCRKQQQIQCSSSSSIYSQPIRPSALESSSRSQTEEDSTVPASYNRSLGELSQQALNTFRPERPQKPLETR